MSQIFDALRHGRQHRLGGTAHPTARGDAVLATLGYRPHRGGRDRRTLVALVLAVAALLLIAWVVWEALLSIS